MILSLILLLTGLSGMSISFIWIIRKGNNNRLTWLFGICQLSIILWLISQLLIIFSVTLQQKRISYTIGNFGISFFAPFWLMFSTEYTDMPFRKIFRIMPVISLSSVITIITDPLFHLYYSIFETDKIEYATGFYIYQIIYYICIVSAMILMFFRKKSIHAGLLILSTAIPLAVNTLTVTSTINTHIELTPLFFAFSSIMILIAIGRYGLLDINSIAMKDIVDNLNTGIIIYTPDGRISYKNNFVNENLTDIDFPENSPEILINGKYLNFRHSHCNNNGKCVAEIVTVNDVTEYHRLSIEKERSRIAQEIHDSAGHTFTMINSVSRILEAEIRKSEPDINNMIEYIRELDGFSRSGITQLRCSINNLRDENFMKSVTQAVKTVSDSLRGGVELCIQGEDTGEYNFCIREVYDNTREAVTNSVRCGAERIDIIIKFSAEYLEIYILDNGKGCKCISEHSGLSGIRNRTEKLGGNVKFSSVYGEGFSVIMKIPSRKE